MHELWTAKFDRKELEASLYCMVRKYFDNINWTV